MHHAYSHSFPAPTVPFVVFTGTSDTTAPDGSMGVPIFEAQGGSATRAIVDKVVAAKGGGVHLSVCVCWGMFDSSLPLFSLFYPLHHTHTHPDYRFTTYLAVGTPLTMISTAATTIHRRCR
jgi:hypothetical protein